MSTPLLPTAPALLPVVLPDGAALPVWSMPAPHAAERHPALVYLASLAPGSRRTMRQSLDVVAALLTGGRADHATLPWHRLRYQHTTAVRAALAEQYKPATANKVLAALRGTLKAAWRLELVDAENYRRAADVVAVRGTSAPAGRELTPGEIRALLETCAADPSVAGLRDAAVLALLYGAGLRRAEAVRLGTEDLEADGANAGRLTVRGKGNKAGFAYVRGAALQVLRGWLGARGPAPGALLLPVSQRGAITYTRADRGGPEAPARLTEHAVYKRLRTRALEAGVRPFSPHDCRRTFAGDLLDAGADIATVQQLLRHASVNTTAKYDRRGERAKRDAADLLHFPHVRF
ncbi:integrase [Gemmatimonadetes bacterium T265]|nr:integrase [Gemmatimonadetes bacterium T265]